MSEGKVFSKCRKWGNANPVLHFNKGKTVEREWRKVTDLKPCAMVAGLLKNGE